ncbi:histidinol-phosphatase HisJ family protein [Helicobacter saguini]|uniref:Histidinol-phosphatase n=1 Tax=Helicobacter saguini TaxID=1548018 RepID=A0A347VT04_9HELI|nr:histidinol-phosphatase [Helicobacter saguini]MWV62290.1 histidinol-phosphatase HisJ family protein [Helicobacter saguini]MWV67037.1 histidinol-phosphatase HisJ family protein [Helicobacter saguini]MWV69386.1 histidinol-phosphatase HisJ family protein [Helicobacter saguini]MWV71059.1 histidinol-phosphatase HisJ family protein [Helicobacter saguini]TLD95038.1 histidinol-phosphatase HisJ family protein [Helicobacter saguini]
MRVDTHNHTIYCNHASGSMNEYIQRAIRLGIDIFGFSCHAPMEFDKKYRMSAEILPLYLQQIQDLKKNYIGQIEILSALEVDFILGRENLLLDSVINADVDYLIGSVHFLDDWGFDNPEFVGRWKSFGETKAWDKYLDSMQEMAKSRLFQIAGHFDLPKIFGNFMPQSLASKCGETLEILHQNDMILEINAAGLRKNVGEAYPSLNVLNLAREIGLDITLSSDAHDVSQVGFGYETCLNLAKKAGYNKAAIFRKKKKDYVEI